MTARANISKTILEVGDFIASETAAQDLDTPDFIVWLRIVEVVTEGGSKFYRVAFPDGEIKRVLVRASDVGRFKRAADFATDEQDLAAMNREWRRLTHSTANHEWFCDCDDCATRLSLGLETRRLQQIEFEERGARLSVLSTDFDLRTL